MKTILDDKREISAIWLVVFDNLHKNVMRVGDDGITKIEVYAEYGQMAGAPWLAVYKGEHLLVRMNAAHVEGVEYKDG